MVSGGVVTGGVVMVGAGAIGATDVVDIGVVTAGMVIIGVPTISGIKPGGAIKIGGAIKRGGAAKTGGITKRCCCLPQGSSSSTIFHLIRYLLMTASSFCRPLGLPGLIFTLFKLRNSPAYLGKLCGRDTYSNMTQRTIARTSWRARRDHATNDGMVTKQRSFKA